MRIHLLHHFRPVQLDGALRQVELGRNLFVQLPGDNHRQNLALASGERFVLTAAPEAFLMLFSRFTVTPDSAMDSIEQFLFVERFGQKISGPGLHRANTRPDVAVCRQEDDG